MTQVDHTTENVQPATGTGEQPSKRGTSGLAAHLSWALHLDEKQAEKAAEIAAQWSGGEGEYAFSRCESPAERLFLLGATLDESLGIEWREESDETGEWWVNSVARVWREDNALDSREDVQIVAQAELGSLSNRKPDFLFILRQPVANVILDVEIDGHDYHSSKEQLADDHRRDIELLMLQGFGIQTIRFTGSQVYADPGGCFRTALNLVEILANRRKRAIRMGAESARIVPEVDDPVCDNCPSQSDAQEVGS